MNARAKEPNVSDGYGVWVERVIGIEKRKADPNHAAAGSYGFFEYKAKRFDLTVKARVYPFLGATTGPDSPHAWGVVFPEQSRKTVFDPKTNGAKETRPYAPEKRFGGTADSREAAMRQAVECISRGGWDTIERNDNGTLTALDETYEERTARYAREEAEETAAVSADVPEGF